MCPYMYYIYVYMYVCGDILVVHVNKLTTSEYCRSVKLNLFSQHLVVCTVQ
jgi:hypothetical protein